MALFVNIYVDKYVRYTWAGTEGSKHTWVTDICHHLFLFHKTIGFLRKPDPHLGRISIKISEISTVQEAKTHSSDLNANKKK